jgi:hypothetical protein
MSGTVVAIIAIHVGGSIQGNNKSAPLLREGYDGLDFRYNRLQETPESLFFTDQQQCGGKKKNNVLVLMDVNWDEKKYCEQNDPRLMGVLSEKEKDVAIKAAKKCFDNEVLNKRFIEGRITDNTETIGELGALISYGGLPSSYGVAMDTFVLDEDYVPVIVYPRGSGYNDDEQYDDGDDDPNIAPRAGDELNFGQCSSGVYMMS